MRLTNLLASIVYFCFLLSGAIFHRITHANHTVSTSEPQKDTINFLEEKPIVDGLVDLNALRLEQRNFNITYDFGNQFKNRAQVSYALGYHFEGLYLVIQTDSPKISYHKRGFLYGDGFKLMIGSNSGTGRSKDYVELAFSPTQSQTDKMWEKYISSYNGDGKARRLSDKTIFAKADSSQGSVFEAFISWDDIQPYHGIFNDTISLNLYFAKGLQSVNGKHVTEGFSLIHDEGIWDEAIDFRNLITFTLDKSWQSSRAPKQQTNHQKDITTAGDKTVYFDFKIEHRTLLANRDLKILFPDFIETNNAQWKIEKDNKLIAEGSVITSEHNRMSLPLPDQYSGEHSLTITHNGQQRIQSFTVLPELNIDKAISAVNTNQRLTESSRNTLLYWLQTVSNQLNTLKPYESNTELFATIQSLMDKLNLANANTDPYERIKGPHKRAFRSMLDGKLMSYTLKLPSNYEPSKQYPVMVFLHGSGVDDESLLDLPRANSQFIEIAPSGRDKFNAYAFEQSKIDINETLNDVTVNFSIDEKAIFVGGFSMGGYGALLTYLRSPEKFKAVAIFAGHPNLANEWFGVGDFPNFLKAEYLEAFNDTPVFIYHGTDDPALSIKPIQVLIDKLKSSGAKVTSSIIKGRGHVYQDEDTQQRYEEWLNQVLNE
ncbi:MAG: prolyl oligopeptidase family serine peptidase [Gammaproteobacteria bacterium]|nr:prolyl oligopeptidase family serine peptidase [Gammaproteobacteria bacterium]